MNMIVMIERKKASNVFHEMKCQCKVSNPHLQYVIYSSRFFPIQHVYMYTGQILAFASANHLFLPHYIYYSKSAGLPYRHLTQTTPSPDIPLINTVIPPPPHPVTAGRPPAPPRHSSTYPPPNIQTSATVRCSLTVIDLTGSHGNRN